MQPTSSFDFYLVAAISSHCLCCFRYDSNLCSIPLRNPIEFSVHSASIAMPRAAGSIVPHTIASSATHLPIDECCAVHFSMRCLECQCGYAVPAALTFEPLVRFLADPLPHLTLYLTEGKRKLICRLQMEHNIDSVLTLCKQLCDQ